MTQDDKEFDFQQALKGIQDGKPFTGKDGVLNWSIYPKSLLKKKEREYFGLYIIKGRVKWQERMC